MESFEKFTQEYSNEDLGLTLSYYYYYYYCYYWKVKFGFLAFIWDEFMDLVEALGANENKYNKIGEKHKNIFSH